MKWIKGFLIFGTVMLAHSTVSINDVEANTSKGSHSKAAPKKGGFFSSFTDSLKKVGSKISVGANALKDKAGSAVKCRAGNGEAPGAKLYALALAGTQLTDAHIVAAHAAPPKSGRAK